MTTYCKKTQHWLCLRAKYPTHYKFKPIHSFLEPEEVTKEDISNDKNSKEYCASKKNIRNLAINC